MGTMGNKHRTTNGSHLGSQGNKSVRNHVRIVDFAARIPDQDINYMGGEFVLLFIVIASPCDCGPLCVAIWNHLWYDLWSGLFRNRETVDQRCLSNAHTRAARQVLASAEGAGWCWKGLESVVTTKRLHAAQTHGH